MSNITLDDYKKFFDKLLLETNRDGIHDLITWLESTDFYTAPASSRFHGAHDGGLLIHSLNVYRCLKEKSESGLWKCTFDCLGIKDDSIIISSLLHDVCKANYYKATWKNQKTYDEEKVANASGWQVKSDNAGNFIWETVKGYIVEEEFPFGHGSKSVYLINKHITLTDAEAVAIRFHMGAYEGQNIWNQLGQAYEKYPLALALHEADAEATHIVEVEA